VQNTEYRYYYLHLSKLAECSATLHVFIKKKFKKKSPNKFLPKKNFKKKNTENFPRIKKIGYRGFTANLGYACENLGGLGPLVWEEIDPAQTVHKPKLKFIYRFVRSTTFVLYQTASKRNIQHIRPFAQSAHATICSTITQPLATL
jgi:hypothetical protein